MRIVRNSRPSWLPYFKIKTKHFCLIAHWSNFVIIRRLRQEDCGEFVASLGYDYRVTFYLRTQRFLSRIICPVKLH